MSSAHRHTLDPRRSSRCPRPVPALFESPTPYPSPARPGISIDFGSSRGQFAAESLQHPTPQALPILRLGHTSPRIQTAVIRTSALCRVRGVPALRQLLAPSQAASTSPDQTHIPGTNEALVEIVHGPHVLLRYLQPCHVHIRNHALAARALGKRHHVVLHRPPNHARNRQQSSSRNLPAPFPFVVRLPLT